MLKAEPNKQLKASSRREILFTKHNFFFKFRITLLSILPSSIIWVLNSALLLLLSLLFF